MTVDGPVHVNVILDASRTLSRALIGSYTCDNDDCLEPTALICVAVGMHIFAMRLGTCVVCELSQLYQISHSAHHD